MRWAELDRAAAGASCHGSSRLYLAPRLHSFSHAPNCCYSWPAGQQKDMGGGRDTNETQPPKQTTRPPGRRRPKAAVAFCSRGRTRATTSTEDRGSMSPAGRLLTILLRQSSALELCADSIPADQLQVRRRPKADLDARTLPPARQCLEDFGREELVDMMGEPVCAETPAHGVTQHGSATRERHRTVLGCGRN